MIARLFAWLLDLKDPKFVVGFSGADMDVGLLQGELDARANSAETVVQRTPDFIDKGLMNFHGVAEIPHGFRYECIPPFASSPHCILLLGGEGEEECWQCSLPSGGSARLLFYHRHSGGASDRF